MNSNDLQLKYLSEIKHFFEQNGIKYNCPITRFKAFVEYKSNKYNGHSIALVDVITKGYNQEGNIEIRSDKFNPEEIHIGFNLLHQQYQYNKTDNKLYIKGNSPKMQGEYIVTIAVIR